jgi:Prenylcysteine lyase
VALLVQYCQVSVDVRLWLTEENARPVRCPTFLACQSTDLWNSVRSMKDKFVTLYESDVPTWSSIESLSDALDWSELTSKTGAEYFETNGVSRKFVTEIIEAATRVNYAQVGTLLIVVAQLSSAQLVLCRMSTACMD